MVSVATTRLKRCDEILERCDENLQGRDEKMERGAGNIKSRDRLAQQAWPKCLSGRFKFVQYGRQD